LRGFSVARHAPSTPKAPEPNLPRKKRFNIVDRVKTSHGTGTIVEIDGEKYLVDLDGQGARLWTKDWALRKTSAAQEHPLKANPLNAAYFL
jgi:hypothetical protein